MKKFSSVLKRAQQRKGGEAALQALLPKVRSSKKIAGISDDRYLSVMTKCINQAGFNWSVIEKKWPQFEAAFFQFDPARLAYLSPEQWEGYMQDVRVVRNWQKISALRDNVAFVQNVSAEHGGFGRFLADWLPTDQIGLMQYLKKHGSRLGGQTCQWFLRRIGKDGFILSADVVLALQQAGVDIKDQPASQTELRRIQDAFNQWHEETGRSFTHLSKIAAYSAGTNYDASHIFGEMNKITQP